MMRITVVFTDFHTPYCNAMGPGGLDTDAPRRTVTIDLTPSQVAELRPRCVGKFHGLEYETITHCFIENEAPEFVDAEKGGA